jgi:hypothetical protein
MICSRKHGLRLSALLVVAFSALALGGCAGTTASSRGAVAYNRTGAAWGPTIMSHSAGPDGSELTRLAAASTPPVQHERSH